MTRSAQEVWQVMEEQAAEDAAWADAMASVSAMSDADLDAELQGLGLEPVRLEREALALWEVQDAGATAQAVAAAEPPPTKRRRPVAMAVWIAASAAAAATAGGLIYTLMHHPEAPPAPEPPVPSPSVPPPPVEPPPLVAMSAPELRAKAAAALDDHRPDDRLKLLDDAKRTDPAGDATPATQKLRQRAIFALSGKP